MSLLQGLPSAQNTDLAGQRALVLPNGCVQTGLDGCCLLGLCVLRGSWCQQGDCPAQPLGKQRQVGLHRLALQTQVAKLEGAVAVVDVHLWWEREWCEGKAAMACGSGCCFVPGQFFRINRVWNTISQTSSETPSSTNFRERNVRKLHQPVLCF